jgi:glycosyltransferase involved in cell wall biosynthesis
MAELGAAQTALALAAALRGRGHDAAAWSPEPLPPGSRWWNRWQRQIQAIEQFAEHHGPFDVIDTPAISASPRLARHGRLVARSVQPELRYLFLDIRNDLGRRPSPRALANASLGIPRAAAILGGWRRASRILCLGSHEIDWMRRRFPGWAPKLALYISALPPDESQALAEVRRNRGKEPPKPGIRFLWIGRWSAQKGTGRLLRFLRQRIASRPVDRFTIAGCGPAAEREMPQEWLSSGRVLLVPSFSRSALPELLAGHDAGLFTSDVEGWGLGLSEMLESGLPVFATRAGAVADLLPYFPASLRPFPPPPDLEPAPVEDLQANGYYERFSWPEIARAYEEQVLEDTA